MTNLQVSGDIRNEIDVVTVVENLNKVFFYAYNVRLRQSVENNSTWAKQIVHPLEEVHKCTDYVTTQLGKQNETASGNYMSG